MNEGELEDPYPTPWILDWRMEMMMIDKEARPEHKWDSIARRNDVRRRAQQIHGDARVNMSER
jgi:hypothetical protein